MIQNEIAWSPWSQAYKLPAGWDCSTMHGCLKKAYAHSAAILRTPNKRLYYISYPTENIESTWMAIESRRRPSFRSLKAAKLAVMVTFI